MYSLIRWLRTVAVWIFIDKLSSSRKHLVINPHYLGDLQYHHHIYINKSKSCFNLLTHFSPVVMTWEGLGAPTSNKKEQSWPKVARWVDRVPGMLCCTKRSRLLDFKTEIKCTEKQSAYPALCPKQMPMLTTTNPTRRGPRLRGKKNSVAKRWPSWCKTRMPPESKLSM